MSSSTPNSGGRNSRGVDENVYFTNAPELYSTSQGVAYLIDDVGSLEQQDSCFSPDFFLAGDTDPQAYPDTIGPSAISRDGHFRPDSFHDPFHDIQGSLKEMWPQEQRHTSVNGGYGILSSFADAGESAGCTAYNISGSCKEGDKKTHLSVSDEDNRGDKKRKMRPIAQLRTASRASKRCSQAMTQKPSESPEDVNARATHNQVEQKYRSRLNQQFKSLLAVLPQPGCDESGMDCNDWDGGSGMGMEKRLSKAEILDLARRRIRELERGNEILKKHKTELKDSVRQLLGREAQPSRVKPEI